MIGVRPQMTFSVYTHHAAQFVYNNNTKGKQTKKEKKIIILAETT